jgi:flagellin FlaB
VLIAFVIVASAFAYAVLNMGFLATQKSQEVAIGGLQAASSTLVIDGPVYGYADTPGVDGNITLVIFWLKTASGVDSVDLSVNVTTVGFTNEHGYWFNVYNTGGGTLRYSDNSATYTASKDACVITWEIGAGNLLEKNERARVTLNLGEAHLTRTGYTAVGKVQRNESFKILFRPPVGGGLEVVRYAPPEVRTVNDLG